MKFYLTSRAEEEINKLEKKKPTKNIKQDISSFFKELDTIEKMRSVDETLGFKGKNTTRKKSRMKNSINYEKDGGFRIYFIVSEQYQVIIICSIYSKKSISNYSKDEIKTVFNLAHEELISGKIILIDIENNLQKI